MVTHDQEEALTMADRILVRNQGAIEQVGTPLEIYREPTSPFVADFIGAMNFVLGTALAADTVRVGQLDLMADADGLAPGTSVTVAIRPEDVQVQSARGSEPNTFEARVELVAFAGSFFRQPYSNERMRVPSAPPTADRRACADSKSKMRAIAMTHAPRAVAVAPYRRSGPAYPPRSSRARRLGRETPRPTRRRSVRRRGGSYSNGEDAGNGLVEPAEQFDEDRPGASGMS